MVVPVVLNAHEPIAYSITIDALPALSYDRPIAIVTNSTVWALHESYVLKRIRAPKIETIVVPDGEQYKTIETVLEILDRLFTERFDRQSLLIAVGGGVIGDMTGFAASLYQRGIGFVQIPTTLLSQVDASVGGKTGVNNQWGKNLIGAFYQPEAVYIDPHFLSTLPAREFSAGVAEVIKMAVMFDADLFRYLQGCDLRTDVAIQEMIRRSVTLKARVVNLDEKEAGIRAVLNYGHTFGHVIESETGYTTWLHGEAVAMGMVMANALAVELDLLSSAEAEEIEALLKRNGLPTRYTVRDTEAFYNHFFLDKKSRAGAIRFVLPSGEIGTHTFRDAVDETHVKHVLAQFEDAK